MFHHHCRPSHTGVALRTVTGPPPGKSVRRTAPSGLGWKRIQTKRTPGLMVRDWLTVQLAAGDPGVPEVGAGVVALATGDAEAVAAAVPFCETASCSEFCST